MQFSFLNDERWWVGRTFDGVHMPLDERSVYAVDLRNVKPNVGASLMLSSRGRYVSSRQPFTVRMENAMVTLDGADDLALVTAGDTLADAYRAAARVCFQPVGRAPDSICFTEPVYNSWVEVNFDCSQEKVLRYAQGLLEHGVTPGVLMIDDNWMVRYGRWRFDRERFPDPEGMIEQLHQWGFRVMMWICPYVVASGHPYLELKDNRLLVMNADDTPKLVPWWNGTSCILDMSNPAAVRYLTDQLDELVSHFGIDGFKFDAGDPLLQDGTFRFHQPLLPNEDDALYTRLGLKYPLAEFRESWNMGGAPLMTRQQDKAHSWDEEGLLALIPNGLAMSLMGYHYHCPDMVGGGDLSCVDIDQPLDQELFIRYTQASVLFPIVQFSMTPHRILDAAHYGEYERALATRQRLVPYLMERVRLAANTHEPIFAPLAYHFPGQGLDDIQQAFCLGDRYIVCPILGQGQTQASFRLPQGRWRDWRGDAHTTSAGEAIAYDDLTISDLPIFTRMDD